MYATQVIAKKKIQKHEVLTIKCEDSLGEEYEDHLICFEDGSCYEISYDYHSEDEIVDASVVNDAYRNIANKIVVDGSVNK